MGSRRVVPRPGDYVAAVETAFTKCPKVRGLHLVSAFVRAGFLTALFEGPMSDFRGPYGAVVRLPADDVDELWMQQLTDGHLSTENERETLEAWVHAAVVVRCEAAYQRSTSQDRGYTPDGVWWLIDDQPPVGQSAPRIDRR